MTLHFYILNDMYVIIHFIYITEAMVYDQWNYTTFVLLSKRKKNLTRQICGWICFIVFL